MARSKAQKAHPLASMAKINSGNKGNADPSSGNSSDGNSSNSHDRTSEAPSLLRVVRVQVLELKRKLHNTHRKLTRAKNSKVNLRAQATGAKSDAKISREKLGHAERVIGSLKKTKDVLCMHVNRAAKKQEVAVKKSQSHSLKEKGVFGEAVREMTRDLTSICQVPVARVDSVIHTVAKGFGITVKDSMDKHSASRITLEGQVAADMQLVQEIHDAGGKFCSLW
jgi:DNA anti-recombination protein RmuC